MRCSSVSGHTIPGAVSFKLYDTYGLALDEQEDMAREHGLAIDREGFDAEMERQRERARASWKGAEKGAVVPAYQKLLEQGRTRFLGYSDLEATSRVIGLVVEQRTGGARFPPARARSWCSIRPRSTPKPAGRWATAARCIRTRARRWRMSKPPSPACPA